MTFYCKGFCEDYKGKTVPNGLRYVNGQKRCSLCCIFLTVKSVRCPCCSAKLRTKPRMKNRY